MDFVNFRDAVAKNFVEMQNHQLFRTAAPKDGMWETYLDAFPEGSNPIYKERTEHDCQCCKQFIRAVGNVVAIIDGRVVTIWDTFFVQDGAYNIVAAKMENYVKSFEIENVFTHEEPIAGKHHSLQDLLEGKVKVWNHFFVNIPQTYVKRDSGAYLGDLKATHDVFKRSLLEIDGDAVNTVLELIDQNSLYRGQENKFAVAEFKKQQAAFDKLDYSWQHDLFVWSKVNIVSQAVTRIRNTSIGTLLSDLSEGVDIEQAVKSFESKVAPTNYKRPTALVTKAMIENAKKTVEDLGLTPSLDRRYAKLTDITINNVLFANRSTRKAMGDVFSELADNVKAPVSFLDRAEDVSIDKFISDILPTVNSIEVMMRNDQSGNLMSLIAPVHATAPGMFKWGNNFSWTYNGDVADSIKERVKKAGGNVSGELCCRLAWDYSDDLDFHMFEADGRHIGFQCRGQKSKCGGMLDVDANGMDGLMKDPVENIFYDRISSMMPGQYKLAVNNYNRRSNGAGFEIEIEVRGRATRYMYEKALKSNEMVEIATIMIARDGGVTIETNLPSSTASKDIWGIKTSVFQNVNAIMYSPNHWDGEGVGNKHFFFMIDGCANDGSARGFYNEFLKPELDQHRKVLEMVGAKMRTDESEHQLSGLGFSSTQHDSVICRVNGSFSRIINIKF